MITLKDVFSNPEMCKFGSWPFTRFKKLYKNSYALVLFKMSIEQLYVALKGNIEDTVPKPEAEPKAKPKKGDKSE